MCGTSWRCMYVFMSRRETASDVMPSSIMMPVVSSLILRQLTFRDSRISEAWMLAKGKTSLAYQP